MAIAEDRDGDQLVGVPPGSIVDLMPDVWTEPFWRAASEHRLVCARCQECGTFRAPPTPFCHQCQAQSLEWVELSGRGVVYSFTIVRRGLTASLEECVPYVIAVVELPDADGVRLLTNVVELNPDEVKIGLEVIVQWDDVDAKTTIPRFRPR